MSNPPSESEPQSTESVEPAVNTGQGVPEHREVVRLSPRTGTMRQRADLDEDADSDEPEVESRPDRGSDASRRRARPLAGALAHGLVGIGRAGVRGAVRYPRASLAAGLSVLILGAVALTEPSNPTPVAQIASGAAGSSLARWEERPRAER